jgi:hypothetical protein
MEDDFTNKQNIKKDDLNGDGSVTKQRRAKWRHDKTELVKIAQVETSVGQNYARLNSVSQKSARQNSVATK